MSVTKSIVKPAHCGARHLKAGDVIVMNYAAHTYDPVRQDGKGTMFDSNGEREAPQELRLGVQSIIAGIDIGILGTDGGMKVGERAILTVSSCLAFGAVGFPGMVPSNTTIVVDLEILALVSPK